MREVSPSPRTDKARMTLLAFDLPTEDFLVILEVAMHYLTARAFPRNTVGKLGERLLMFFL